MKKLFIALILLSTTWMSAIEAKNIPLEILISDEMPLTQENIAIGKPIHAHIAMPSPWFYGNRYEHMSRYIDGYINTMVDENALAFQEVFFVNTSGDIKKILKSDIWRAETLDSKKYIVFYYQDFRVFSTKYSQFVIAN